MIGFLNTFYIFLASVAIYSYHAKCKNETQNLEEFFTQSETNESRNIIDEIEAGNELETDESEIVPKGNFFQRLFKGKKSKS